MVKAKKTKTQSPIDPTGFLSIATVFISLYLNSTLADPFNSPKLWALMVLGSWGLGHCLVFLRQQKHDLSREQKIGIYLLLGFLTALLAAALTTEISFNAFYGEQQRRLGFLFYLFMAIFMLTASLFITSENITKIYKGAIFLGIIFSIYGFMQYSNSDFISWNNPYNSIILTLGNPNYASALMAILSILILTYLLISKSTYRFFSLAIVVALLILITLSNSRQGLISFAIGMSVVIVVLTYLRNKKLGIGLFLSAIPIFLLVILAMLQIGPLVQYVYKTSVSIRGFYWRAGIEMFKSNIWTGIGVDSYGDYFRLFREKEYPFRFGFQIMSDNAHNVPIQIFSTSGIFTGLAYLSLLAFVFFCGIKAIKQSVEKDKVKVVGIFGAWVSFQAQSIISIDNVGLTIWGWVLSGALIGLCGRRMPREVNSQNRPSALRKSNSTVLVQKLASATLALIAFITSSVLYQGEKLMYELSSSVNSGLNSQSKDFYDVLGRFQAAKLVEPAYKFRAANILFQVGEKEKAQDEVNNLLKTNSDSYDYLNGSVQIYLANLEWGYVIQYSKRIAEVDPYNAQNLLLLAEAYLKNSQTDQAVSTYKDILFFAEGTPQGDQAADALSKLPLK